MVERVWGDGEMGGLGVWEKLKNIYLHHYHAGLPKFERRHEGHCPISKQLGNWQPDPSERSAIV